MFLSQRELLQRWNISKRTLVKWREYGTGPNYCKIGGKVRYKLCEVLRYEQANNSGESVISKTHEQQRISEFLEVLSRRAKPRSLFEAVYYPQHFHSPFASKILKMFEDLNEVEIKIISLRADKKQWKVIALETKYNKDTCREKWAKAICKLKISRFF